jgi:hypothetical protein
MKVKFSAIQSTCPECEETMTEEGGEIELEDEFLIQTLKGFNAEPAVRFYGFNGQPAGDFERCVDRYACQLTAYMNGRVKEATSRCQNTK